MALVSMRELLDHAATNGYGIPAFNVNNLEQVQAVMSAADEVGAPVILQAAADLGADEGHQQQWPERRKAGETQPGRRHQQRMPPLRRRVPSSVRSLA